MIVLVEKRGHCSNTFITYCLSGFYIDMNKTLSLSKNAGMFIHLRFKKLN